MVAAPFVFLRRGYFRVAVVILIIELFLFALTTVYMKGLEEGWIGALEFALPISLAALALGRRDTGCGIATQVQQHIFEPFFTTNARSIYSNEALGMSLSGCSRWNPLSAATARL